jgi:hypothetical protein
VTRASASKDVDPPTTHRQTSCPLRPRLNPPALALLAAAKIAALEQQQHSSHPSPQFKKPIYLLLLVVVNPQCTLVPQKCLSISSIKQGKVKFVRCVNYILLPLTPKSKNP